MTPHHKDLLSLVLVQQLRLLLAVILLLPVVLSPGAVGLAQTGEPVSLPQFGEFAQQCGTGVHPRGPDFAATGLLLTTFSRDAMWVVDLVHDTRYPLPETVPCGPNCRPAPDRSVLLYVSPETATYWTMRPDGTARQQVLPYYFSELDWWDDAHWLAWPTAGLPALYPIGAAWTDQEPTRLADFDVFSIQPGGYYGLRLTPGPEEWPILELVNLQDGQAQFLTEVRPYLGGAYWSPDGGRLVFIGPGAFDEGVEVAGSELYVIEPGVSTTAQRLTDLSSQYGAVRVAGRQAKHAVTWSPDGRYLAFWVLEVIGPDKSANVGQAVLHILDTQTGQTTVYCGFGLNQSDPVLPEPVWSPDGQYIAFGADVPGDARPAIMFVLDTLTGDFTEVTTGMYAAYGSYDPVMWGLP